MINGLVLTHDGCDEQENPSIHDNAGCQKHFFIFYLRFKKKKKLEFLLLYKKKGRIKNFYYSWQLIFCQTSHMVRNIIQFMWIKSHLLCTNCLRSSVCNN